MAATAPMATVTHDTPPTATTSALSSVSSRSTTASAAGAATSARRAETARFECDLQALQIDPHVGDRLVAEIRIFFERLLDDPLQLLRQSASHRANRRRLALENRNQQVRRRRSAERRAARHELVQDDADAVTIRSPINREPARLFRRHVRDRADDHPRARLDRRRHRGH